MSDFVMDKSDAGAGFLSENFGFPCTIYIPSASPQSSSVSPEAGRSANSLTNQIISLQLESSAVAFRFGDHVITAKQQR
jgi:hypothetical protein